jgi:hypothetical protein
MIFGAAPLKGTVPKLRSTRGPQGRSRGNSEPLQQAKRSSQECPQIAEGQPTPASCTDRKRQAMAHTCNRRRLTRRAPVGTGRPESGTERGDGSDVPNGTPDLPARRLPPSYGGRERRKSDHEQRTVTLALRAKRVTLPLTISAAASPRTDDLRARSGQQAPLPEMREGRAASCGEASATGT